MSKTRSSIAEILEECRCESAAERALELARIGEHVCRPRRLFRFSGLYAEVVCETCGEAMQETSILKQIARRKK